MRKIDKAIFHFVDGGFLWLYFLAYRQDQSPRCEQCGDRVPREHLEFDQHGRPTCTASGRSLVRSKQPTMVEQAFRGTFAWFNPTFHRCARCGRAGIASVRGMVALFAPSSIADYIPTDTVWGVAMMAVWLVAVVMCLAYEGYERFRFPRSVFLGGGASR